MKAELFKWFVYNGKPLAFTADFNSPDFELHLQPGDVFGIRKTAKTIYAKHKNAPGVTFKLKVAEMARLVDHSKGWEGKVKGVTVKAGKGGQDRVFKAPENMRILSIDSSNLKAAKYDTKAKTLYVTFHSGVEWAYEGVTKREVDALENAESQGRYFIYRIRDVKEQYKVGG